MLAVVQQIAPQEGFVQGHFMLRWGFFEAASAWPTDLEIDLAMMRFRHPLVNFSEFS